ncbi:MAG TPA: CARDB domain-containing protein [Roseiflexaceae bacterium]|nr:CARDB domain-containing protein [Roseiflexaceae bacterium]
MIFRAPLHLLALIGLLVALGSQTARSQPDIRPAPTSAASQIQRFSRRAQSATPVGSTLAATAAVTETLTNTMYLPSLVLVAPPPVDLSIDGLEITQAVQTPNNSVPLVAGRPAIVRVYAKYTGTVAPGSVTLSLTGARDGVALEPVTLGPRAISASPSRATYSSSFNLPLPASWLSGTVAMTATVDSDNHVAEADETNNTTNATLAFNTVPALDIVIVPVRYTDIPSGVTYAPPTVDTISDFIRRTYPLNTLNVTFRSTPMNFVGDLSDPDDWGNNAHTGLLDQVTTLKDTDLIGQGGINSPKVYYGLVSTGTSLSNTWLPFNSGFILGIGWIGTRVGAGLDIPASFGLPADITSDTAAHEIGHNLGRYHAPCDTTTGIDKNYPDKTASIVQFGVDVSKGKLLNPSTTKDVMSYCEPQWISDYTYKALYRALGGKAAVASSAAPGEAVLVRGGIAPDGTASLAPVYDLVGVPDSAPESSDYRVEFLDAAGSVIASQPVAVLEMEQPHVVALSGGQVVRQSDPLAVRGMDTHAPRLAINALIPARPFASLRLVRAGTVLATRVARAAGPAIAATAPSAQLANGALVLRWGSPGVPALVRYTADGGATWTTIGVDVLGGELSVGPATLPGSGGTFEIVPADGAAPAARIAMP